MLEYFFPDIQTRKFYRTTQELSFYSDTPAYKRLPNIPKEDMIYVAAITGKTNNRLLLIHGELIGYILPVQYTYFSLVAVEEEPE